MKGLADEISTLSMAGRWVMSGTTEGTVLVFDISHPTDIISYRIIQLSPCAEIDTVVLAPNGRIGAFAVYHVDPRHQALILCDLSDLRHPVLHDLEGKAFDIRATNDRLLTRASDGTSLLFDLRPTLTEIVMDMMKADEDEVSNILGASFK